jgi:hypothetical protein
MGRASDQASTPTGREIRQHGAGHYADPFCKACLGFGVLALNGGPAWIPCTSCVWPDTESPMDAWHRLWDSDNQSPERSTNAPSSAPLGEPRGRS